MKILEINKFYNAKRGADKHFLDVIELLEKNGNEVAAFSMRQAGDNFSKWEKYFLSPVGYSNKFTFWQKIKGTLRMFYSFEAHQKIRKILSDFKPEIVHIHNIYHQMDPTILFEIKKQGIPIMMTVHDFKIINPNHSMMFGGKAYNGCKNSKFYQCFFDKAVKNSYSKSFVAMLEAYWHSLLGTYENVDIFIVPSYFVKERLLDWGIAEKKIKVVPHFKEEIFENNEIFHKEVPKQRYAFYAGKISKEKGADLLMDIFKNDLGINLYLAGEVENDFEILQNKNIVNLGILNKKEVQLYMKKSQFVISASKLPETFGLIALEAISAGAPFVGFKVGAFSEVINNENLGLLANSEEEFLENIKKISTEEIKFEKSTLLKRAENFSPDNYLEKFYKIAFKLKEKHK
jgi:glycosyltransferase involved in cell wall biosynthesis